jgi:hypothetical protein
MFKSNKYLGGDNLLSKLKKQTRSQDLVCFILKTKFTYKLRDFFINYIKNYYFL